MMSGEDPMIQLQADPLPKGLWCCGVSPRHWREDHAYHIACDQCGRYETARLSVTLVSRWLASLRGRTWRER